MMLMMMMALLKALAGSEARFNCKRFGSKGGMVARKRFRQERRQSSTERSSEQWSAKNRRYSTEEGGIDQ